MWTHNTCNEWVFMRLSVCKSIALCFLQAASAGGKYGACLSNCISIIAGQQHQNTLENMQLHTRTVAPSLLVTLGPDMQPAHFMTAAVLWAELSSRCCPRLLC